MLSGLWHIGLSICGLILNTGLPFFLLPISIRVGFTSLSDSHSSLLQLLLFLDLSGGFLVQLTHQLLYLAGAVIEQQLLIQERVLIRVVQLQSATFTTTKRRHQGVVDHGLHMDWHVLF